MKKITSISILALFILTGCNTMNTSRKSAGISRQQLFMNKSGTQTLPTLFWSHYDISQRGGIYLVNAEGKVTVISENPPDAAINSNIDALAKANVTGQVDAAAKFSAVKAVAELGQRNAANYMIRDLAFRIEALKNNEDGKPLDPDVKEIFLKLIASAENISIAESKNKIYDSKATTLQELNSLIKLSKDDAYKDLKIDSDFIEKIGEFINQE